MSCHQSQVLTVPQTTFCSSPAKSTSSLESHHQRHHPLLLQRRRRLPQMQLRRSFSEQQLSPSSSKQQELQLKIQQQLDQQNLQKQQQQQWQPIQQLQQYQNCVLQQPDASSSAVNDNDIFDDLDRRHVSLGGITPSQNTFEVKAPVVQQEYDYVNVQAQQNGNTQYSSQFSQNYQFQQENTYKLFDGESNANKLFSRGATATEFNVTTPAASFSYFNNSSKEQSMTLSELTLTFLADFEEFSLDGQTDFSKNCDSKIDDKSFSYFTVEPNPNFMYPIIYCSTNIDSFVNPLEASPDICQEARPGSGFYKITNSTSSDGFLIKNDNDKSSNAKNISGLNKLQVLSEIQNLELITSPKFNDFPQNLKEYLLSERMILADVRSIIASQHSNELQSSGENNVQKKTTEQVISPESKTYANILQSVPQYDLKSSSKSDEQSYDIKPIPVIKRNLRRSRSTNGYHNVNNLKNGIKKSSNNELLNSASALEKRKKTKLPYKIRKPISNNKNSKIYNDSWRVEVFNDKKYNN